jgi:hypothetical protein
MRRRRRGERAEERRFRRKTLSDRGTFGGFLAVFFRKIAFAAWNFGANPL